MAFTMASSVSSTSSCPALSPGFESVSASSFPFAGMPHHARVISGLCKTDESWYDTRITTLITPGTLSGL